MKDFQTSAPLGPKRPFTPCSLSQNSARAKNSWNACRGLVASQFMEGGWRDQFSIVCGWSFEQCEYGTEMYGK